MPAGVGFGGGVGSSAVSRAMSGTALLPGIGTAIGAGAGLFSDMEARKQRKKEEKASRPERRRLTEIQQSLTALRETKLAAQMTAAQSAFDWASNLRI